MLAALYVSASVKEKGQTNQSQLRELRLFAEKLGYSVYQEYCDEEGTVGTERPSFRQLFADAHKRQFNVVIFWRVKDFTREGNKATLKYLKELKDNGITCKSFNEPYFESMGPSGDVLISALATIIA